MKTDFDGLPIAFDLTGHWPTSECLHSLRGGEASDSPHFETLLDLGPDIQPRAVVADKVTTAPRTGKSPATMAPCR